MSSLIAAGKNAVGFVLSTVQGIISGSDTGDKVDETSTVAAPKENAPKISSSSQVLQGNKSLVANTTSFLDYEPAFAKVNRAWRAAVEPMRIKAMEKKRLEQEVEKAETLVRNNQTALARSTELRQQLETAMLAMDNDDDDAISPLLLLTEDEIQEIKEYKRMPQNDAERYLLATFVCKHYEDSLEIAQQNLAKSKKALADFVNPGRTK